MDEAIFILIMAGAGLAECLPPLLGFDDDAGRDRPRRRAVTNPLVETRNRRQHDIHGAETVADDASRRAEHGMVTAGLAGAAAGQQQRRVRRATRDFRWTGPQAATSSASGWPTKVQGGPPGRRCASGSNGSNASTWST
jgi:hypothetical protein